MNLEEEAYKMLNLISIWGSFLVILILGADKSNLSLMIFGAIFMMLTYCFILYSGAKAVIIQTQQIALKQLARNK